METMKVLPYHTTWWFSSTNPCYADNNHNQNSDSNEVSFSPY